VQERKALPTIFLQRERRLVAHNVIFCRRHLFFNRKCSGQISVGAPPASTMRVRAAALSPNDQKAGDFHRYNCRMDVAADLERKGSLPPLTSNPGTTATTSISYDDNGNVIEVGTTTFYAYDFDNRLIQSNIKIGSSASTTITYAYDPFGNRISQTASSAGRSSVIPLPERMSDGGRGSLSSLAEENRRW
jgi:YD repeat-containing protein